jgi:YD repeat-containing protein
MQAIQVSRCPIKGPGGWTYATGYAYDADSRLTRKTLPEGNAGQAGIAQEYASDNANRLSGITYKDPQGAVLEKLDYTYDAAGRRTGKALQNTSATVQETPMGD